MKPSQIELVRAIISTLCMDFKMVQPKIILSFNDTCSAAFDTLCFNVLDRCGNFCVLKLWMGVCENVCTANCFFFKSIYSF